MPVTSIDIDPNLWEQMKQIIAGDPLEYPSMSNFVNKSIRDKVKQVQRAMGGSDGTNSEAT